MYRAPCRPRAAAPAVSGGQVARTIEIARRNSPLRRTLVRYLLGQENRRLHLFRREATRQRIVGEIIRSNVHVGVDEISGRWRTVHYRRSGQRGHALLDEVAAAS
ncbi:MAG: hypothetical protein DMG58_37220 [Acidobacteria bacterium]|nr:MAG: hypothetical protein DMG58_37220 [Acidobacteriota bacterium]